MHHSGYYNLVSLTLALPSLHPLSFNEMFFLHLYIISPCTGIIVGFENTTYTVVEGDSLLVVCAIRIAGTRSRALSLTFSPISGGNATCKYIVTNGSYQWKGLRTKLVFPRIKNIFKIAQI